VTSKRSRLAAWLAGDGIEIGALHRPLSVPPGVRVRYVDRLPEAELRRHYPELGGQPFAPVSILGSAEDLSELRDDSVDFVIANHLLEHLEYPLRGLLEFQRVLRRDGILYLALPDQRQTFDRDRELTPAAHIFDEHFEAGADANRWAHYLDWALNVDKKGAEAEAHARHLLETGYSIHFHVWRPDTFFDLFVEARERLGLDLELLSLTGPEQQDDDEFILLLAKGRGGPVRLPRHEAAEQQSAVAGGADRQTLRQALAASPLGPPVRLVKRTLRRT
jgi:SAM-dependent methyltransferase